MKDIIKELLDNQVGKVKEYERLEKYTTIKIGGPADIFVEPTSIDHLVKVMDIVKKYNVPWRVIGRGSNLLVSDEGIRGIVIRLGRGMDHLTIEEENIRVGGGYSVVALSTLISRKGLSGLEFASGIPGSIGGAVYMNAGAHGSDISKILTRARILFEDGTIEWLSNDEMMFSYRTSILQKQRPGIVIEAEFALQKGEKEKIVEAMQKNKEYRKETQPWDSPCAGSIFRNPLPHYAGQLIEQAGLKGYSIGGAKISEMHGNFIVNAGGATAKDVLSLIEYIKNVIKEKYNIEMETEVEIIGKK